MVCSHVGLFTNVLECIMTMWCMCIVYMFCTSLLMHVSQLVCISSRNCNDNYAVESL